MKKSLIFFVGVVLVMFFVGGVLGEIIPSDRKIDWDPGVEGGIPSYPITRNAITDEGAVGDDVTDDTTAIQNCINNAGTNGACYLPTGTYRITGSITIPSNVVLRGTGPNSTIIKDYSTAHHNTIVFPGGGFWGLGPEISIINNPVKGLTQIDVSDASTLEINDYITIFQDDDPSFVNFGGCNWCGDEHGHRMGQITKIIGKSGNTLTLEMPLYLGLDSTFNPGVKEIPSTGRIMNAGIEDMKVERVNAGGGYGNNALIRMRSCIGCWVENVETYNSVGGHIEISLAYKSEIRDNYLHHGHSYTSGMNYGVWFMGWSSDVLVENNIIDWTRHSVCFEGGGSGCVIGYNYFLNVREGNEIGWLHGDFSSHGSHPYMNLWEGNIGSQFAADNTWGSSSHNTYFRNWARREDGVLDWTITWAKWAAEIEANQRYLNFVGNILGYSGCDGVYEYLGCTSGPAIWRWGCNSPGGSTYQSDPHDTALTHGNFDYFNEYTVWDTAISDHNILNSLYLTSKPAFFECRTWPTIGPDLSPMIGSLPAKDRFNGIDPCAAGDTSPPVRSNPSPTTNLSSGTTQTIISLTTDENANCRYSTTSGINYPSMPNTFSTTGGTSHSELITGLNDGNIYNYYVRCNDTSGNYNTNDFLINFGVSQVSSLCGPADTNSDGVVNIVELMNYIADWKAGSVNIVDLMTGISEWKNGCS